ncbi:MAG: BolA/IbaG family iron-sulfur metabolism protein [Thermoplasmatota archaeon]
MDHERFLIDTIVGVVPDAQVHPTDLNGGGDHWHVVVVAASFEGQRSFQRQRPILAAFTPHIQSGVVHALDLKCITPQELADRHEGKLPQPFVPHQRGEGDHPGAW